MYEYLKIIFYNLLNLYMNLDFFFFDEQHGSMPQFDKVVTKEIVTGFLQIKSDLAQ